MTADNETDLNEDDYVVDEDSITSPVFQDTPGEINEDWTHGVLIGGMATETSDITVAEAYWWAAQALIEPALRTREAQPTVRPMAVAGSHPERGKWSIERVHR